MAERSKNFLIAVIDVLLILSVVLILAIFSITNNEKKGAKDLDFVGVTPLEESIDIEGNLSSYDFYALVLTEQQVEAIHYNKGTSSSLGIFNGLEELFQVLPMDPSRQYVIYETEKGPFIAELARFFSIRSIPFGIAKVGR